jgi:hypothetical protein
MTIDPDVREHAKLFNLDPALVQAVRSEPERSHWFRATLNPRLHSARVQAKPDRGGPQRQTLAVNGDVEIAPSVPVLVRSWHPPTVAPVIRAVCVNAVECVARWARPQVFAECGEVVRPLIAHRNPAPAVVRKGLIGRCVAAALRMLPRLVLARHGPTRGCAVLVIQSACSFAMAAAAALSGATPQTTAGRYGVPPAITGAHPICLVAADRRSPQNDQAAVSVAGDVDESHRSRELYHVVMDVERDENRPGR